MRLIIASIVVTIGLIGGAIYWFESTTPHSTRGVTIVGDNEARLPEGETMIMLHTVGKVTAIWQITFSGNSVNFVHDQGWPFGIDRKAGTVHGVGTVTDVGFGWGDHFYVSLRPDGAASVKWPDGYNYRA